VSRRPRRRLTIWPLAVLAALVLVGMLVAGCDPPGGRSDQPAGTFEVDFSTPRPIVSPWSADS
jgi:hypothetical protein